MIKYNEKKNSSKPRASPVIIDAPPQSAVYCTLSLCMPCNCCRCSAISGDGLGWCE